MYGGGEEWEASSQNTVIPLQIQKQINAPHSPA